MKKNNHPFFSRAEFIPSFKMRRAGLSGWLGELKKLLPFEGKVASYAKVEEVGRVDI